MKKILSVILCIILCIGCFAPTAFAQEETPNAGEITLCAYMAGYDSASLDWTSCEDVYSYSVLRSESENGEYSTLASTADASYIDNTVQVGKTYYYKIVSFNENGESMGESNVAVCTIEMGSVNNLSASIDEDGYIRLYWSASGFVDGVNIYRIQGEDGEDYTLIGHADGRSSSFEDESAKVGVTYFYKAAPCYLGSEGAMTSAVSATSNNVGSVYNLSAYVDEKNNVVLSWESKGYVNGYEIYSSKTENGEYEFLEFTDEKTTIDDIPYKNSMNYYKVVPVYNDLSGQASNIASVYVEDKTPKAGKITSFTAQRAGYSSIQLDWEKDGAADGYIIYRSETEVGGYVVHTTVKNGDTSTLTVKKGIETGKTYYFKIRPYITVNGKNVNGSVTSAVSAKATLDGVTDVNVFDSGKLSVNVNWNKVEGASGYIVYRSTTEVGGYSKIADVTTNSYEDFGVSKNNSYFYKIKPYITVNGKNVNGGIGGPVKTYVSAPVIKVKDFTAKGASYNSILLEWEKDGVADGYIIYRSETEVGGYVVHTTVKNGDTSTLTVKKGIETGKTYYFKIRPYITVNGKNVNGSVTSAVSAKATLSGVTNVTAQDSGKLSVNVGWSKVAGASGYIVYRSTTEVGGYSKIAYVTTNSYEDLSVSQNGTYYYKIKPYITVNGKKVYGGIGGPESAYVDSPRVDDVTGLTATKQSYTSVILSWKKAGNADGYKVYRSESRDGGYVRHVTIKNGDTTIVLIKSNLDVNKTYYFKIVPYITVNGKTIDGNASEIVSFKTKLDAPKKVTATPGYAKVDISWSAVPQAEGYYVYRTDYDLNGKELKTVIVAEVGFGATSYTDYSVWRNNEYRYSIEAYGDNYVVAGEKGYASKVKVKIPGDVEGLTAATGVKSAQLSWDKTAGATGYVIYRSVGENGEFTKVGETTNSYFTDNSLAPDTVYYYMVAAYVSEDGSNIEGNCTEPYYCVTEKVGTTVLTAQSNSYNTIDLSWEPTPDVSGYAIYRSEEPDGEYILHTTRKASDTSVTLKAGIKTGTTYNIKVVPYVMADDIRYSGWESNVVSVTPNLKASVLSAESETYDTVGLAWSKVDGADGYIIYRSENPDEGYERLTTINNPDKLTVVNKVGVNTGTTYYYKLVPFINVDGERVLGEESNTASATPYLDVPTISAQGIEYNKIELSWDMVNGANGYKIYRSESPDGEFDYLTTITDGSTLSVVNKQDVLLGKTYYYKIRAFRTIDEQTVYSDYSAAAQGQAQLAAPTVDAVSINCNQILVSWNEISGATGYVVYRSLAEEGVYTRLTTIKGGSTLSVVNQATTGSGKVEVGETYYYKVRAIRDEEGSTYFSDYSNSDMAKAAPTQPKLEVKQEGSYPEISWNKIDGADGYILYRSVGNSDDFVIHTRITDPDTTSVTNKSKVEVGQTYYYKVAAYVDLEDGSRIVGEPSEVKDIKVGNNLYIERLCEAAEDLLGTPYVSGGKTESGVDCSGFVYLSFKNSGYTIPYLTSYEWARSGYKTVSNGSLNLSQLKRGDVLCFSGHVGLYLGDGVMIDSGTSSGGVRYCYDIQNSAYWTSYFICAKRVFE